jgi:tetratricopeptide (TPR) repeat protein
MQFVEHPDDVKIGLRLAAGLYLEGKYDEALELVEQVRHQAPEDEGAAYLLARLKMRTLDPAGAIEILEKLAQRYPRRVSTHGLLAETQMADFRLVEARQTLQHTLELPAEPVLRRQQRLQLLSTYTEFMEYDEALKLVEQWAEEEPDEDVWAQARLRVLLMAGREGEVVAAARASLDPVTKRFDELLDEAEAVVQELGRQPEDATLQARLKALERELNDAGEAMFEQRSRFVQVCIDAGQLDVAKAEARGWLEEQPDNPQFRQWLIEALLAASESDAALETIAQYVPKTPADVV